MFKPTIVPRTNVASQNPIFYTFILSVHTRFKGSLLIVKLSLLFFNNLLPSSPGANLTSNSITILLNTTRNSASASCLPMQENLPIEKGKKAFLLRTRSGSVVQRSGMNSSGRTNACGAEGILH